jgi:hypothetical protein
MVAGELTRRPAEAQGGVCATVVRRRLDCTKVVPAERDTRLPSALFCR